MSADTISTSPPKFSAVCCVFDDDRWLPVMVESIAPAIDRILFLVAEQPWNGGAGDTQSTLDAIRSLPNTEGKIELVRGPWRNETEQRNAGLQLLRERQCDYAMIVDADEIYDPVELERMKAAALAHPQVGAWYVSMFTYWHSAAYRIDPPEQFTPVVFVKVGEAEFTENRHVKAETVGRFSPALGICHHLSYARSNEEVRKKLARFSHSHEIQPGWYQNVWLTWRDESPPRENLHPVYPSAYRRAVRQDPSRYPPALKRALASERDVI